MSSRSGSSELTFEQEVRRGLANIRDIHRKREYINDYIRNNEGYIDYYLRMKNMDETKGFKESARRHLKDAKKFEKEIEFLEKLLEELEEDVEPLRGLSRSRSQVPRSYGSRSQIPRSYRSRSQVPRKNDYETLIMKKFIWINY